MRKFYYFISVLFFVGCLNTMAIPSPSIPAAFTERDGFSFADPAVPGNPDEANFNIYINEGILYIKYNKPQELVKAIAVVYNILGQEITRKNLENTNLNQIEYPFLQNTCYIIKIQYSGKLHTQKVLVSNP